MKKSTLILTLVGLALIVGIVSWYGLDLIFKGKGPVPQPTPAPQKTEKLSPTIPTDIPQQMRERMIQGKKPNVYQVEIIKGGFKPVSLTVEVGDRVTWTNSTNEDYQIQDSEDRWGSETLKPGDTFSQFFDASGTFKYSCKLHPELKGTIIVEK